MNKEIAKILRKKSKDVIEEVKRLGFKGNLYKEYKLIYYKLSSKMKELFKKKAKDTDSKDFYNYVFFGSNIAPVRTKSRKEFEKHYASKKQKLRKK